MLISNAITNNIAGYGGGVYLYSSANTLLSNTISNNTATGFSGGVYQTYGNAILANNTISNNTATAGGGLYLGDNSAAT